MKTQFIKVSALRKFINSRGRKSSDEFMAAVDADVRNKVSAACGVHNGGRKTLDASVAGHVGILRATLLALFFGLCWSASAMSRFQALAQIESGENDVAIGRAGEISRYQILPVTWENNCLYRLDLATNTVLATEVMTQIMEERGCAFYQTHHRWPTDFEFYLLWSCPSHVDHPSAFKAEVATRFANLCAEAVTREGREVVVPFHPLRIQFSIVLTTTTTNQ